MGNGSARTTPLKTRLRILLFLVGIVAAVGLFLWSRQRHELIESRIPELTAQLERVTVEIDAALTSYAPKTPSRIDDLSISANDLLKQLPGVVNVQWERALNRPAHRIIHLRDWHFVPKDIYGIAMEKTYGRKLAQEEKDHLFRELLLEIEIVQVEQMGPLRCLIRYHGLKTVFCEGVYADGLVGYRKNIDSLRGIAKQVAELEGQLREVRRMLKTAEGDRKEKAKGLEKEILTGMDDLKPLLLEVGAAGRLLITKELEAVLPLEDSALEDLTNPYSPEFRRRVCRVTAGCKAKQSIQKKSSS